MNISNTKHNDISQIVLNETRLDAAIAPTFKSHITHLIDEGHTRIILNIQKLSFMDSSSLGAMVSILKYLGARGELVIVGANGVVADLFHLTRMDKVFILKDNMDEAMDYLN